MNTKHALMLAFVVLYAAACATPALRHADDHGAARYTIGWTLLLWGWVPPYVFAWIANPLMLAGWSAYLCRGYRVARVLGLVAAATGLFSWYLLSPGEMFVGYFLWQASPLALTACAYLAAEEARRARSRPPTPPPAADPN